MVLDASFYPDVSCISDHPKSKLRGFLFPIADFPRCFCPRIHPRGSLEQLMSGNHLRVPGTAVADPGDSSERLFPAGFTTRSAAINPIFGSSLFDSIG
jgi:hypothetical protein